jgi:hypothetical protein
MVVVPQSAIWHDVRDQRFPFQFSAADESPTLLKTFYHGIVASRVKERYFCTYLESNFRLGLGLALYNSLVRHVGAFVVWILCMDDLVYETLRRLALPHVRLIQLDDFERGDKRLERAKVNRSRNEYYFTCKPSLALYILNGNPEVDVITYLDADLFFFSDASPIYSQLEANSVLITESRLPLRYQELYGIYNAGFASFRRDGAALECLSWWRDRCLEWCYDRIENGRYSDQKYLDDWPTRFKGVVVLKHKGANLAPWNVGNYRYRVEDGRILVDSEPIIFFHFSQLWKLNDWLFRFPCYWHHRLHSNLILKRYVYGPYVRELRKSSSSMPEAAVPTHPGTSLIRDVFKSSSLGEAGAATRYLGNVLFHSDFLILFGDTVL